MTDGRRRLGLSFQTAMRAPSHALRTDIACFIGTASRRRVVQSRIPLPEVMVRWLVSKGYKTLGDHDLRDIVVDISRRATVARDLLNYASGNQRTSLATLLSGLDLASWDGLLSACRHTSPLPKSIVDDLYDRGFVPGVNLRTDPNRTGHDLRIWTRIHQLQNLPFACESLEQFTSLFEWERRGVQRRHPQSQEPQVATPLGAAVRAYFGEGGQKCYIVVTGEPSALFDSASARFAIFAGTATEVDRLDVQLPHTQPRFALGLGMLADVNVIDTPVSTDPADWRGLDHVYGLPDVSFVCMPDVVDVCTQTPPTTVPPEDIVSAHEEFHACYESPATDQPVVGRRLPLPRLNSRGLVCWRKLISAASDRLRNGERSFNRRDVQLVASLPLVGEGRDLPVGSDWLNWMKDEYWVDDEHIQVAYPWWSTTQSADCQGGIEAPEGMLAGVLARNSLARGAFRSAAFLPLIRVVQAVPELNWTQIQTQDFVTPGGRMSLPDRVCLLAPDAGGARLLSDVTLASNALLQPGSVRRLINVVINAARRIGEEIVFGVNGEILWSTVRYRLQDLGRQLLSAGALSSDASNAFVVRCDRTTMTQNDLDAGRLIAEIEMSPAYPITRILITLALRGSSPLVSLRNIA